MMKIELEFKPQTLDDGVIMYSGQSDNGRGDYFAVLMKAGYLEFRYNTGSGKYSITINASRDKSLEIYWLTSPGQ